MRHIWTWPLSLIVTLFLAGLVGLQVSGNATGRALTGAAACCLLALLAFPGEPAGSGLRQRLGWSLLAASAGAGIAAAALGLDAAAVIALAACMALLIFLLLALTRLFAGRVDGAAAGCAVATAALAAAALPVYLGALPEHFPGQPWLANAVVFGSPLSHLAGLLDYDYLREPWLYRHSRLGGLRFDYPSAPASFATLLMASVALEWWGTRLTSTTRKPTR